MVIIRINANVHHSQAEIIANGIHRQARTGVIVLPPACELLNEVPADETIKVVYQQEDDTEKERDAKEFSRRLMERLCSTCKERYAPPSLQSCWACDSGSHYHKE